MISELELLTILAYIQNVRARLTREEIRAASLLASMFSGRLVRYDSVEDSMMTLQKKGFLKGDLDRFELTAEGGALVSVFGEKRIGRSRLESLRKLIEPLTKAPSTAAFILEFGPQVTEMLRAQKSKLAPVGGELVLCALLVRIDQPEELFETVFTLPERTEVEQANRWKTIRRLEDHLTKELGRPIHITLEKNRIVVQSPRPIHTLTFGGREIEADSGAQPVSPPHRASYRQAILSRFLSNQLRSAGYSPVGSMHRVFVRIEGRAKAPLQASVPAVRLFYQILNADRALVWLEEFTKPWLRALDLIADTRAKDKRRERLTGQLLRTLPYESPGELVDVTVDVDVHQEFVPESSLSYYEYWLDRGYELEERVQPLLVIRTKTGTYSYPAETILIRSGGPDPDKSHRPWVLSPQERADGLEKLGRLVFPKQTIEWRGLEFVLEGIAPTVGNLPPSVQPQAAFINPPLLRFGAGAQSGDPLDVFTKGPEAGRKRLVITHVFHPTDVNGDMCVRALRGLVRHYAARGFGDASLDPNFQNIGYPAEAQRGDIGELVRRTRAPSSAHAIAVAFLEEGDESYYGFKRFFPEYCGAPIQAIQTSTIPELEGGNRGVLDQLALNLYLKRLSHHESAWTLVAPAGGSDRTSYLAISFSRGMEPKRAGKGVAALHDATGRGLNWGLVLTPGEVTLTQSWFETVLEQIRPLLEEEPSDRLVFYRPGTLHQVEIEAIQRAFKSKFTSQSRPVDFVAVLNEHRRFFLRVDGVLQNPPPGTAIFWSDQEVLLAESGFMERGIWRGTVVPVGLRRVLGDGSMKVLAAEYHDLTHLSWSAPTTTWKHPLVMKIAERLAEAAREGVPSTAIRFLPL